MVPRAEIISIDRYVNPSRLKEIFIDTGLSKILIHHENIDNIVGYISIQHMFSDYKSFKSIIIPIEFVVSAKIGVSAEVNIFCLNQTSKEKSLSEY